MRARAEDLLLGDHDQSVGGQGETVRQCTDEDRQPRARPSEQPRQAVREARPVGGELECRQNGGETFGVRPVGGDQTHARSRRRARRAAGGPARGRGRRRRAARAARRVARRWEGRRRAGAVPAAPPSGPARSPRCAVRCAAARTAPRRLLLGQEELVRVEGQAVVFLAMAARSRAAGSSPVVLAPATAPGSSTTSSVDCGQVLEDGPHALVEDGGQGFDAEEFLAGFDVFEEAARLARRVGSTIGRGQ